jgi:hypothetical protein
MAERRHKTHIGEHIEGAALPFVDLNLTTRRTEQRRHDARATGDVPDLAVVAIDQHDASSVEWLVRLVCHVAADARRWV